MAIKGTNSYFKESDSLIRHMMSWWKMVSVPVVKVDTLTVF